MQNEALREFQDAGAATLTGILGAQEVFEIREWLRAIVDRGRDIPASLEPEFEDGTDVVRKLRRLYWNDRAFWARILEGSDLLRAASTFVGKPLALTFHAAFTKSSAGGSPVALHQDQALWTHQYPGAVSIWVALTSADRHNGGLVGCPGSHRRGAIAHGNDPHYRWHGAVDWRAEGLAEPVPYDLAPGDALAWHRDFVHGSGPNTSADPRWGFVMVFVDRTRPDLRTRDRVDL